MSRAHSYSHSRDHSPTLPLLHLRHSSLSNPCVALPTSQLNLQLFRCFTYVTAHSPTLSSLYLRHNSFSNPFVASPTSQLISNPSFASPTSQDFHLRQPGEPPMQPIKLNIFKFCDIVAFSILNLKTMPASGLAILVPQ